MEHDQTVFVIDDDPGVRNSLCMTLQAASLNALPFASAEQFLTNYQKGSCGCIVLDLRLEGMSGLELLQRLRSRGILTPVIMITGHGDVSVAVQSMKLGAVDFLEKPIDPHDLVARIKAAMQQHQGRQAQEEQIETARQRFADVTERELEVLRLLAIGKLSKQIAKELEISMRTVEKHRSHLLERTGAQNIADLIRLVSLAGIV